MDGTPLAAGDETRMAILALLSRGAASRAAVARELDLSPATVSQVTRRLIKQGVIETLSFAPSDGGRPGQLLGLVGGAGRAIGAKLAADHLVLVDVGLDGEVRSHRTEAFDALAPDAIERLVETLQHMSAAGPAACSASASAFPAWSRTRTWAPWTRRCSAGRTCRSAPTCAGRCACRC